MKIVLKLAEQGKRDVNPNPMVGAVLVNNGEIVSKGFHKCCGDVHAEVDAINNCDPRYLSGSDLYVNLEPCNHHGQTPPCSHAIVDAKIKRVFCGMSDPNPLVSGAGFSYLREHGVEVVSDILADECRQLNEVFIKYITSKKPFTTLKIAQTLDGKVAAESGRSKWITGEEARTLVHKIRSENDAVLVGINTLIQDDCRLNVRNIDGKNPKRIILDTKLRFPEECAMTDLPNRKDTIIVTSNQSDKSKKDRLLAMGLTIWEFKLNKQKTFDIEPILTYATEQKIASLLVEGGMKVFTSFLVSKECDKVITFIAPKIFGGTKNTFGDLNIGEPEQAIMYSNSSWTQIGQDMMFEGRL